MIWQNVYKKPINLKMSKKEIWLIMHWWIQEIKFEEKNSLKWNLWQSYKYCRNKISFNTEQKGKGLKHLVPKQTL